MEEELDSSQTVVKRISYETFGIWSLAMPLEVRQGAVTESVGNSGAVDDLGSDAGNHLTQVEIGSFGAASGHDARSISFRQCFHQLITS